MLIILATIVVAFMAFAILSPTGDTLAGAFCLLVYIGSIGALFWVAIDSILN
jgi:hypothetical protein